MNFLSINLVIRFLLRESTFLEIIINQSKLNYSQQIITLFLSFVALFLKTVDDHILLLQLRFLLLFGILLLITLALKYIEFHNLFAETINCLLHRSIILLQHTLKIKIKANNIPAILLTWYLQQFGFDSVGRFSKRRLSLDLQHGQ